MRNVPSSELRVTRRRRARRACEPVELHAGSVFRVLASSHPLLAACASAKEAVLIRSIDEAGDYAHITVQGTGGRVRATAALPLGALANSSLVLAAGPSDDVAE